MLTVSEEQAVARRLRVPVERLHVAKRVRTRTVQVHTQVEVSYEELVMTRAPVDPDEAQRSPVTVMEDDHESGHQVVLVLSEQIPVLELQTRPVERVTVATRRVQGTQRVQVDLAREVIDVDQHPTTSSR